MMELDGKIAVITGSDSGIGQATAEAFAKAGADICVTYHTDEHGAGETLRRVEAAGRRGFLMRADITDPASVFAMFKRTVEHLGTPDILVANAGDAMGESKPVAELDNETLAHIITIDLLGPVYCAREFLKLRKAAGGRGRIVFIGSVAGHLPTPDSAPYGMAKAGVNSLTRSLSVEVAADKINVNCIAPGLIATPMTARVLNDPEKRAKSMESIPWHRPGEAHEIAGLALFLASDAADYVTGQTLVMDGGLTMHWGGA